jgi:hypothetical protein
MRLSCRCVHTLSHCIVNVSESWDAKWKCRIALEAAATSPVIASLAASSMNAAHVSKSSSGHAQQGSSAAQHHLDNMVHIVAISAKSCWLAVSEEEKLQPAHCQALLEAFFSACLFVADTPAGLR